jgi:hypothetical protein
LRAGAEACYPGILQHPNDEKAGDYSFRTTCIKEVSSGSICTVNPKALLRFNMVVFSRRISP